MEESVRDLSDLEDVELNRMQWKLRELNQMIDSIIEDRVNKRIAAQKELEDDHDREEKREEKRAKKAGAIRSRFRSYFKKSRWFRKTHKQLHGEHKIY